MYPILKPVRSVGKYYCLEYQDFEPRSLALSFLGSFVGGVKRWIGPDALKGSRQLSNSSAEECRQMEKEIYPSSVRRCPVDLKNNNIWNVKILWELTICQALDCEQLFVYYLFLKIMKHYPFCQGDIMTMPGSHKWKERTFIPKPIVLPIAPHLKQHMSSIGLPRWH